jgi:hypothetical protein
MTLRLYNGVCSKAKQNVLGFRSRFARLFFLLVCRSRMRSGGANTIKIIVDGWILVAVCLKLVLELLCCVLSDWTMMLRLFVIACVIDEGGSVCSRVPDGCTDVLVFYASTDSTRTVLNRMNHITADKVAYIDYEDYLGQTLLFNLLFISRTEELSPLLPVGYFYCSH